MLLPGFAGEEVEDDEAEKANQATDQAETDADRGEDPAADNSAGRGGIRIGNGRFGHGFDDRGAAEQDGNKDHGEPFEHTD